MVDRKFEDAVMQRIHAMNKRVADLQEHDLYFYNQPITELRGGARVLVNGREMSMFASYSYLGLIGHPRINAAAQAAIEKYGTGTHGVRTLAGTLTIHRELEETIANFKGAEIGGHLQLGLCDQSLGDFHLAGAWRLCDLR